MAMINLRYLLHSIVGVALVIFMKVLSSMSMSHAGLGWYYSLNLPSQTPPAWVFGPVWTIIYMCMTGAIANILWIYRVGAIKTLSLLFFVHATIHVSWSYLFFVLQSPSYGLISIGLMWLTLVWLLQMTFSLSKLSFSLLMPYFLWLTFATYLSLQIYLLN